jgi:uncharacterized protein YdeI (YjbR/CyaY-like superfamily)
MTDTKKVDAFIEKHTQWKSQLQELRGVFNQTDLKEEVKWGAPTYTHNGKMVAGIAAFKNHYAIWFHQGVFLKDKHKKLVNAQEGVTKALRQWRFEREDKIEPEIVLEYIQEAIANAKAGKEVKKAKKKNVSVPPILKNALENDKLLKESYNKLTPGRQREYAEHIGGAKREATQQSRLKKCAAMIKEGKGLHDKYKNC